MQPASLRFIAKTAIVRFLVCNVDPSQERDVVYRQLQSNVAGLFCETILVQILDDFPQELTDDLLVLLAPPHLRQLKLSSCDKLTVEGLNKTIHKCNHIQFLDFSKCIHLLHPSMFFCLKEKALNLTAVSLEESELVTDDIVQVLLMCCPGLQHLNLSSCKNITDLAFAINKPHVNGTPKSSQHALKAGMNLTSIDISGCRSLSSVAIKHLVDLCGPSLTSVNLAWTGLGCVVLLFLAGLSFDAVEREVRKADPSCAALVELFAEDHGKSDCDDEIGKAALEEWNKNQAPTGATLIIKETLENVQLEMDSALSKFEDKVSNWNREGGAVGKLKNARPEEDTETVLMIAEIDKELRDWKGWEDLSEEEKCREQGINEQDLQMAEIDQAIEDWDKNKARHDVCKKGGPVDQMKPDVSPTLSSKNDEPSAEEGDISSPDESVVNLQSCKKNDSTELTEMSKSMSSCSALTGEPDEVCKSADSRVDSSSSQTGDCNADKLHTSQTDSASSSTELRSMSVKEAWPERLVTSKGVRPGSVFHKEEPEHIITHQDVVEDEAHCEDSSSVIRCCSHGGSSRTTLIPEEATVNHLASSPTDSTITKGTQEVKEDSVASFCGSERERTDLPNPVPCPTRQQSEVHVRDTEESMPASIKPEIISIMELSNTATSSTPQDFKMSSDSKESHSPPDTFVRQEIDNFTKQEIPRKSCASCEHSLPGAEKSPDSAAVNVEPALPGSQCDDFQMGRVFDSKITSLDISSINFHSKPLGSACLKLFSQANTCLKKLSLSWSELDDSTLCFVLQNQPELESLSVVDCEGLGSSSLLKIPVLCPSVSHVDLQGVYYVCDSNVCPLIESRQMVSLSLAEAPITDSTLRKLGEKCGNTLTELDFSWCEEITDVGMAAVVESCPNLRCLGLRQCRVASSTLNKLASRCHLMTSLNIAGLHHLDDEMVITMVTTMPLLVDVDLSWNLSLTDKAIHNLLLHCKRLAQAGLSGLKRITSKPFLGIISDLAGWHFLQDAFTLKRRRPSKGGRSPPHFRACDAEIAKSTEAQVPFRSTSYAPLLRHVTLEYSDKVNDDHLSQIVCVCRGTLYIRDYYGQPIEPKWVFL